MPPKRIQGTNNRRIQVCHQKEREMISSVEIPDIGYRDSIGIVEMFLKQKKGYYKSYFYI